jgi:hypothetical protein
MCLDPRRHKPGQPLFDHRVPPDWHIGRLEPKIIFAATFQGGTFHCQVGFQDTQHLSRETSMPRGDKSKYTDKQERQAEHIEESYEKRGVGKEEAEHRAWATVNKEDGGGKKPGGSGRKTASHNS